MVCDPVAQFPERDEEISAGDQVRTQLAIKQIQQQSDEGDYKNVLQDLDNDGPLRIVVAATVSGGGIR